MKEGYIHRKVVEDTNAGRVSRSAQTATNNVSITGGRSTRSAHISDGDRQQQALVSSLVRAAGVVGNQVTKEKQRRDYLAGQAAAGTEAGQERMQELQGSIGNKIFGPGAWLRGAQERTVKTTANNIYLEALTELPKAAQAMDTKSYEASLMDKIKSYSDQFDDQQMKDAIAMEFGKNLPNLTYQHQLQHGMFLNLEESNAFQDSLRSASSIARQEIARGDPDSVKMAYQRIDDELDISDWGGTDGAFYENAAAGITADLMAGSVLIYDRAESKGLLGNMTPAQRTAIDGAHKQYTARHDADFAKATFGLETAAEAGNPGQVERIFDALSVAHPDFAGVADKNSYMIRALRKEEELRQGRIFDARMHQSVYSGRIAIEGLSGPDVRKYVTSASRAAAVDSIERAMRDEYAENGQTPPEDGFGVTTQMADDYIMQNPQEFVPIWKANDSAGELAGVYINNALAIVGMDDLTEEAGDRAMQGLEFGAYIQREAPEIFSDALTKEEQRVFARLDEAVLQGGQPLMTALAQQKEILQREAQGTLLPVDADTVAAQSVKGMDDILKEVGTYRMMDFDVGPLIDQKDESLPHLGATVMGVLDGAVSMLPFGKSPAQAFREQTREMDPGARAQAEVLWGMEYEREMSLHGRHRRAKQVADTLLKSRITMVGSNILLDNGANKKVKELTGVNMESYITRMQRKPEFRQKLITGKQQFPSGFNLLTKGNRYAVVGNMLQITNYEEDYPRYIAVELDPKVATWPENMADEAWDKLKPTQLKYDPNNTTWGLPLQQPE